MFVLHSKLLRKNWNQLMNTQEHYKWLRTNSNVHRHFYNQMPTSFHQETKQHTAPSGNDLKKIFDQLHSNMHTTRDTFSKSKQL
jgi:hypothetical protein